MEINSKLDTDSSSSSSSSIKDLELINNDYERFERQIDSILLNLEQQHIIILKQLDPYISTRFEELKLKCEKCSSQSEINSTLNKY